MVNVIPVLVFPPRAPETWGSEKCKHGLKAMMCPCISSAAAKGILLSATVALEGSRAACLMDAKKFFPNPAYWHAFLKIILNYYEHSIKIFFKYRKAVEKGESPLFKPHLCVSSHCVSS